MSQSHGIVKLRCDFFDRPEVMLIESEPDGDELLFAYIKLLFECSDCGGVFVYDAVVLSEKIGCSVDVLRRVVRLLEYYGVIKSCGRRKYRMVDYDRGIVRYVLNGDGRGSREYRMWRGAVLKRDNFTCQRCGAAGGRLNVHHISPWAVDIERRFDVSNGVVLCPDCHRAEHKRVGRKSSCQR